jgi:hypothetical protein
LGNSVWIRHEAKAENLDKLPVWKEKELVPNSVVILRKDHLDMCKGLVIFMLLSMNWIHTLGRCVQYM